MKTVIDDLILNLKRIKPETMMKRSVSNEALEAAADINRQQLNEGELSDGSKLNNYSKATLGYNDYRKTKVSTSDVIKFKDTGKFHKSIKATITKDAELKLDSRSKRKEQSQAYVESKGLSGNVLGLQEEWVTKWYETFVEAQFQKDLIDRILSQ